MFLSYSLCCGKNFLKSFIVKPGEGSLESIQLLLDIRSLLYYVDNSHIKIVLLN